MNGPRARVAALLASLVYVTIASAGTTPATVKSASTLTAILPPATCHCHLPPRFPTHTLTPQSSRMFIDEREEAS